MPLKLVNFASKEGLEGGRPSTFSRMATSASVKKRVMSAFLAIVFDEVILLERRFEPFGGLFQDQTSDISSCRQELPRHHTQQRQP
ncbi:hypothetical protein [Vreelandella maris]|uniref:hypothetical protein n=1 Tax=Vreelandella maris TaxID=2729617 RepID=UPI0030EDA745